jgi:hypothetical protein
MSIIGVYPPDIPSTADEGCVSGDAALAVRGGRTWPGNGRQAGQIYADMPVMRARNS